MQFADHILLWPAYCSLTDPFAQPPYLSSFVMRSTDGGMTWIQIIVGSGVKDGRNYDESAIAVWPNGLMVMILRQTIDVSYDIYGSYWRSQSTDSGVTWSAPKQVVNVSDVSRPTLALLRSGGLVLMGRAEIAGVEGTTGFGTSWDEGQTFTQFSDLGVSGPGLGWDQYDAMSILPMAR